MSGIGSLTVAEAVLCEGSPQHLGHLILGSGQGHDRDLQ